MVVALLVVEACLDVVDGLTLVGFAVVEGPFDVEVANVLFVEIGLITVVTVELVLCELVLSLTLVLGLWLLVLGFAVELFLWVLVLGLWVEVVTL